MTDKTKKKKVTIDLEYECLKKLRITAIQKDLTLKCFLEQVLQKYTQKVNVLNEEK